METPVDVSKFDNNIPSWVKGVIGSIAAIFLIPPIALSIAMKFGGFESIVQDWTKSQLKISEPMVKSNDNLAIQMLQLNRTIIEFRNQMDEHAKIIDVRISNMGDTLTIHGEQINSGLKELQKLQEWAYKHSKDGNYAYDDFE